MNSSKLKVILQQRHSDCSYHQALAVRAKFDFVNRGIIREFSFLFPNEATKKDLKEVKRCEELLVGEVIISNLSRIDGPVRSYAIIEESTGDTIISSNDSETLQTCKVGLSNMRIINTNQPSISSSIIDPGFSVKQKAQKACEFMMRNIRPMIYSCFLEDQVININFQFENRTLEHIPLQPSQTFSIPKNNFDPITMPTLCDDAAQLIEQRISEIQSYLTTVFGTIGQLQKMLS